MDLELILGNLLTPPVLFFFLGMAATLLRSDLEIPQAVTRGLSLYLLFAIGMHGGHELAVAGFSANTLLPLAAGVMASALFPLTTFALLRKRLGAADAAAIAATYGSISAVTFITACSFLDDRGIAWSGTMVAAMALMESPAILVAVLLARRSGIGGPDPETGNGGHQGMRTLLREAFLNGPVFLLIGSLIVGATSGEKGWMSVKPFVHDPFKGVLCLFLLELGTVAAGRMRDMARAGWRLVALGCILPAGHGIIGTAAGILAGMSPGGAAVLGAMVGSASYIAAPAAVRIALPKASPGIYLTMALGITFPFNLIVGIPLFLEVAAWLDMISKR